MAKALRADAQRLWQSGVGQVRALLSVYCAYPTPHAHLAPYPPYRTCLPPPVIQTLPVNSVFINGARVALDGNTFNVFDLLAEVPCHGHNYTHSQSPVCCYRARASPAGHLSPPPASPPNSLSTTHLAPPGPHGALLARAIGRRAAAPTRHRARCADRGRGEDGPGRRGRRGQRGVREPQRGSDHGREHRPHRRQQGPPRLRAFPRTSDTATVLISRSPPPPSSTSHALQCGPGTFNLQCDDTSRHGRVPRAW